MTGRRQGAAGDELCPHLASNSPRPDLRAGTFSPVPVPSHLPRASASYISHSSSHLFLGQRLFIAQAAKRRGGWSGEDRAVEGVRALSPSLPTPRAAPSPVPAARKQPSLPPHAKGRAPACLRAGPTDNGTQAPGGGEGKAGQGECVSLSLPPQLTVPAVKRQPPHPMAHPRSAIMPTLPPASFFPTPFPLPRGTLTRSAASPEP